MDLLFQSAKHKLKNSAKTWVHQHIHLTIAQKTSIVTLAVLSAAWTSLTAKLIPAAPSGACKISKLDPVIASTINALEVWAVQAASVSIATLYGATYQNLSEPESRRPLSDDHIHLPFSEIVLQASRIYAKINEFFYPNIAASFLNVHWRLGGNLSYFCVLSHSLGLTLKLLKAYSILQDFGFLEVPNSILPYGIAGLQVLAGIQSGNVLCILAAVVSMGCFKSSPAYSLTKFLPPSKFTDYLILTNVAAGLNLAAFSFMINNIENEKLFRNSSGSIGECPEVLPDFWWFGLP